MELAEVRACWRVLVFAVLLCGRDGPTTRCNKPKKERSHVCYLKLNCGFR
jgi:hypothetical protein